MELLGGFAMAGALWYGSREIAAGDLTMGEFTSFIAALLLMYGPAKKLSRVNANLQQAIAASERIFEMLDIHTEVTEKPGAQPLAPFHQAIEFRDVSFGYEESPGRILRDVTLSVPVGPDGGDRRPQRRGQDDAGEPAAALLRRERRAASWSTAWTSGT